MHRTCPRDREGARKPQSVGQGRSASASSNVRKRSSRSRRTRGRGSRERTNRLKPWLSFVSVSIERRLASKPPSPSPPCVNPLCYSEEQKKTYDGPKRERKVSIEVASASHMVCISRLLRFVERLRRI
jgi:hypothetical protein